MDNRNPRQERDVKETSNGLAHGVENIKATITRRPELQGWLFVGAGALLLLHTLRPEWVPFLNYILIGFAVYLLLYGSAKAHLVERTSEIINWVRDRFGGTKKR